MLRIQSILFNPYGVNKTHWRDSTIIISSKLLQHNLFVLINSSIFIKL